MPDDATPKNRLVLIDGNSLLYRGFFSMRALTTSAGTPTNAIFAFTNMLMTLFTDQVPDVMYCAWDTPEPTFRHIEYTEYKGTRQATPPDLVEQGPIARELTAAFNVTPIEAPGFEADDIIGTLAKRGKEAGYEVVIVTGDLDALQLVEPHVYVLTTIRGVTDTILYDEEKVKERYGLRPDQLADYRALKGDTSDNIPGVPGVGDKTASQLLQQYDNIENLISNLGEIKQAKLKASLENGIEQMKLSKHLAVILRDVKLPDVELPSLDAPPTRPDWTKVRALFERLEFRTMLRRVPSGTAETGKDSKVVDLSSDEYDPFAEDSITEEAKPEIISDYRVVETPEEEAEMLAAVRTAHRVALALHTTEGGIMDAKLLGVSFAIGEGRGWYVAYTDSHPPAPSLASHPEGTRGGEQGAMLSLFDEPIIEKRDSPLSLAREGLGVREVLEQSTIPKIVHDAKTACGVLCRHDIDLQGVIFDTELAAYLLSAGRRAKFPLREVVSDYAGRELHPLDAKERKGMDEDAILGHERSEALAGADAIFETCKVQEGRLSAEGLTKVMDTLDLPVAPILADMEQAGVCVDVAVLNKISAELSARIADLEKDIFEAAGTSFTVGSPKQLAEVLFEKMGLPSGKKNKTGYSTDADVLEELAPNYPIVSKVLQHRELSKLKGTYTDAMPLLVRPDTGRIHTTLNQTVAATGRLSSTAPNLQNIPIRTEIGREIRRAFVAPKDMVLISADYSQIELRLFAHITEDPALVDAFFSGEDIHKYTASKMYNVPLPEVTSDMRRAAKTVNYAVIYGISDFALARSLKIPQSEAKELKKSYFDRFPGVPKYVEETIQFARDKGYVETMYGRRRYFPDITSRVFQFRQAAERAASNMPIQGAAADIMKMAMIHVYERLKKDNFHARILMQVHDELLIEAKPEEVPAIAKAVREEMSSVQKLKVALDVDVKTGATWADVTPVPEEADELD